MGDRRLMRLLGDAAARSPAPPCSGVVTPPPPPVLASGVEPPSLEALIFSANDSIASIVSSSISASELRASTGLRRVSLEHVTTLLSNTVTVSRGAKNAFLVATNLN